MCIAIPPKYPCASVIGISEREERHSDGPLVWQERNFTGEHFWARGYAVSTVGFELEQVANNIRDRVRGW